MRFPRWIRRFILNRTSCQRGGWKHGDLLWQKTTKRRLTHVARQNKACEMMVAGGLGSLARWIAVCERCGVPVLWSSDRPGN